LRYSGGVGMPVSRDRKGLLEQVFFGLAGNSNCGQLLQLSRGSTLLFSERIHVHTFKGCSCLDAGQQM
jgi:hypothetical protein